MVAEFVDGISLTDMIANGREHLQEPVIAYIIKNVLQALQFMHSLGVIHRDVKSDQILLSLTGDILLGM